MGSILSSQSCVEQEKSNDGKNIKMVKNWEVLEKAPYKEILKSKKTSLIVQRYWFEMENYEDFQSQNKLFQWRSHNPNSEFMVNVLSVGKDEMGSEEGSFQCGSIQWCPTQKVLTKVYVVTERILKLDQIQEVLKFQKEIETNLENGKPKILYATDQISHTSMNSKKFQKVEPFLQVKFTEGLGRQLLKDWIRGIEVLCYKFGYFNISQGHLGMTIQKRGTAWISNNYGLNSLNPQDKIQVGTAEQKFKFQKDTIHKILELIQNIPCFKSTVNLFRQRKIQRFDQFCNLLDQIGKAQRHSRQHTSYQPQRKNGNNSLFVQHGSFIVPNNVVSHNNSSFFMFDHQNAIKRVNSNTKPNSSENIVSLETSLQKKNSIKLINSGNSSSRLNGKKTKRSNTKQKIDSKISPESLSQGQFISSNHKNCGKQTLPTNQLGHSSSLQSVNHATNMKNNFEDINSNIVEGKTLFKSQNQTKVQPIPSNERGMLKPSSSPSNKIYFHNNVKPSFSSEPLMFRSHKANDVLSPKSPRPNENMSFNSPVYRPSQQIYHNYSLDENNIVGPYRKDRFYSNLRKEKIAMVDSMVMVRQQSEEIQDDLHNMSRGKYILEESIIIMGKQDGPMLSEIYN